MVNCLFNLYVLDENKNVYVFVEVYYINVRCRSISFIALNHVINITFIIIVPGVRIKIINKKHKFEDITQ